MAIDWNISRADADADVMSDLRFIKYYHVIAAWRHPCGALLVVANLSAALRNVYLIQWRATPSYKDPNMQYVAAFEEPDPDAAWTRVLATCEGIFEAGPRGNVLECAVKSWEKYKANQAAKGRKGGDAKAANEKKNSAEIIEAKRIAAMCNVQTIPDYNPRKWKFSANTDRGFPLYQLTWLGEKDGSVAIWAARDANFNSRFTVYRSFYPDGDSDCASIDDRVMGSLDQEQAAETMRRLALDDPKTWLKGEVKQYRIEVDGS